MTDENEISKAARDAFVHGTGFMRDGKHVPVEDVYISVEEAMADEFTKQLRKQFALDIVLEQPAFVAAVYENERDHAADLIEELTERNKKLEAALREIAQPRCNGAAGPDLHTCIVIASAALGEKTDG